MDYRAIFHYARLRKPCFRTAHVAFYLYCLRHPPPTVYLISFARIRACIVYPYLRFNSNVQSNKKKSLFRRGHWSLAFSACLTSLNTNYISEFFPQLSICPGSDERITEPNPFRYTTPLHSVYPFVGVSRRETSRAGTIQQAALLA